MAFQLGFKPLEKGEGICCRARKASENLAASYASHLTCISLHNGLTH